MGVLLNVWFRCECGGYLCVGETHDVGDKVNYVRVTSRGKSVNVTNVTGRIISFPSKDEVGVIYRGYRQRVHKDNITSNRGVNALSVGLGERCDCDKGRYT